MNTHETGLRYWVEEDIDWALGIAIDHFGGEFDINSARAWAKERLKDKRMVFLRTEHAFGVAHLSVVFHAPKRIQAYMTLLYAEPKRTSGFELLRILTGLSTWAKSKGATKFRLGDITGYDLGPLVRRLGGEDAGKNYVIDLDGMGTSLG